MSFDSNPLTSSVNAETKYTKMYNNPGFDYMSEMLPKNIQELFKWAELVYNNAPIIANGVKKLINYPLTSFVYKTNSESIREKTKDLVEKKLNLRSHLINLGVDYYIYGNAFRTVYFPFDRYLKCSRCNKSVAINYADYKIVRGKVVLNCECGYKRPADVVDEESSDISRIRLVSWDPKQIDMSFNPVTCDSTYYYSLPPSLRKGLAANDPTMFNTLPKIFLESYYKNRSVKFGANLYHFKAPGLSGYATGWGISPLMPALKPYLYVSILRKASEAIGLEHITPQKILYPESRTNDPSVFSSMSKWKSEIQSAVKRWRMDPNHVMLAPYPTGSVNIGSQGRGLMPTEEIRQANQEMALSMDVPPDFIYGSGTIDKSTVSLRILENQLTPYVEQLTDYMNWIIDKINAKYDKEYCQIELSPFTLADDTMKTQLLMQTAGNMTSKKTLMESIGLDPDEEYENMKNEAVKSYTNKKEVEQEISDLEQNISTRTQEETAAETTGKIPAYNQQKLFAHAQSIAQQLITIPYEERRSQLSKLQNEDYVMWAMVSKQLESLHEEKD